MENKVLILNDLENFPKLPKCPKETKNKVEIKDTKSHQEVERKLKAIEDQVNKQMKEKLKVLKRDARSWNVAL